MSRLVNFGSFAVNPEQVTAVTDEACVRDGVDHRRITILLVGGKGYVVDLPYRVVLQSLSAGDTALEYLKQAAINYVRDEALGVETLELSIAAKQYAKSVEKS